jgi:protein involved in polysaccharide export with SLBB domain
MSLLFIYYSPSSQRRTVGCMRILAYLVTLAAIEGATARSVFAQASANALRPGDVVRLRIYREPDLSGEFQINEQNIVFLPRLGAVPILEWPVDSIRARVTQAYAQFLRDPVIEVTLLRRIAIYGFVLKPGLYPVDPTMTVQEALALAGGANADGTKDRVELLRDNQRILADLRLSTSLDQVKLHSGDQLFVPQMGWWARNGKLVIPALITAFATVTAILHN